MAQPYNKTPDESGVFHCEKIGDYDSSSSIFF